MPTVLPPDTGEDEERERLLSPPPSSPTRARPERQWWKASPYWIVPVVLISNLCRGMTMAPRIEVYTQLACRALHEDGDDAPSSWPPAPSTTSNFTISANDNDNALPNATTLIFLDPDPSAVDACSADPAVQCRAARIHASVKTTESVLSAITTGYLSHLGDRHGRKLVLSLSVFGALFMDVVYLLVSDTDSIFSAHGEGLIIAAPFVEGLLGAHPTYTGVTHAYATDRTPDGSRARFFVMMQGMLYAGLALGPWLNSAVLNISTYAPSPFAVAVIIALCNLLFILFLLPESLPPHRRVQAHAHDSSPTGPKNITRTVRRTFASVSAQLVRPVVLFYPPRLEGGRRGRNWNFTLTGLALFIYVVSFQILGLRYLYAKHVFGWTSEELKWKQQLGHYMSLLWTTRAVTLLLLLPAVLSYFRPRPSPSFSPSSPNTTSPASIASALVYDRALATLSLLTDALLNTLIALVPPASAPLFVFLTTLTALTGGGTPALQSLGAAAGAGVGRGDELGLVFGALGVVNAVAYTPAIYAAVYAATVADLPRAIFALTAALLVVAVALLLGVRPHVAVSSMEDGDGED
ncbi:major facilitator superfamily domain-containing protein [Amylostereum chailletii]|nr:major facilitator superfamily domain-containing protein [Amylostereum chailletii]